MTNIISTIATVATVATATLPLFVASAMPRDLSQCPQGNPSQFVHAVTKTFDVYICGGDLAHVYVGVPKNGSRGIVLPLENTEGKGFTFVAVNNTNNGYYRYVLTRNRLTVTKNGTTIVSEAARWD